MRREVDDEESAKEEDEEKSKELATLDEDRETGEIGEGGKERGGVRYATAG